jgi:hypothetical protein
MDPAHVEKCPACGGREKQAKKKQAKKKRIGSQSPSRTVSAHP